MRTHQDRIKARRDRDDDIRLGAQLIQFHALERQARFARDLHAAERPEETGGLHVLPRVGFAPEERLADVRDAAPAQVGVALGIQEEDRFLDRLLAEHDGPADVAAILRGDASLDDDERRAALRVLLARVQADGDGLWSTSSLLPADLLDEAAPEVVGGAADLEE